jgi:hypothetical protein
VNFTPAQQRQAMHRIELDLVEFCDMHCHQCTRAVAEAPSKRLLKPESVAKFVCESVELQHKWQRIHIIGGEPTLHPQFLQICDTLAQYKQINPDCVIELRTNGGQGYQKVKDKLPRGIQVSDDRGFKTNGDDPRHHDHHVAPSDYGVDISQLYCPCVFDCGLGFGPYGYLPCHLCAGLVRVFNIDGAVKSLKDVTPEWWLSSLDKFCGKCGFLLVENKRNDLVGTTPWNFNSERGKISPSWEKALQEYDPGRTDHLVIY